MNRVKLVPMLTALTVAAVLIPLAVAAHEASASTDPSLTLVTSSGTALNGATVGTDVSVQVAGLHQPAQVKYVLDGHYVGASATSPFSMPLSPGAGAHTLKARVAVAGTTVTQLAYFTVGALAPGKPAPTASPTTAAPTPTGGSTSGAPTPTGAVVHVTTAAALTAALASAKPGQTIQLANGTYSGRFSIAGSGTASAQITLTGSRGAVLDAGSTSSGYALHLDHASYWRLEGFSVTGGQKGIVLDASSHDTLNGLDVGNVGMEAVHFRDFSTNNVLSGSNVHDTGLANPSYGEGVYLGSANSNWKSTSGGKPDASDDNQILKNTISATTAESIDIKEGSTGGTVSGNSLSGARISGSNYADSFMDIKGNGYLIAGNTMIEASSNVLDGLQTHQVVSGWGEGTVFSGNVLSTKVPGYVIRVDSPKTAVRCDNQGGGAHLGLSNVSCA
jgi:hypothetical protein